MNTTNQPQTSKGILRNLTIIHMAFCTSIFLFGIVVLYVTKNQFMNFTDTEDRLFYVVPVLAIVGPLVSQYLFKKTIFKAHSKSSLMEKLMHYQSSKLIQIALIEGPALLGIVGFLTTSNQYYLIFSAALLIYLVSLRPTPSDIRPNLNFNAEQEREFRDLTRK
ncbi:hypothetical protein [Winogradskyella schleiferi]|uniref:hypothetical protein n=1 Tax=Winogradskyella schleiferi TaxID=2686078 RepID=UPI0015BBB51D|nr:hypothetical protein [Winogradskyella schleiferi]